jgi:non-ribosomal peptide synthetase component F
MGGVSVESLPVSLPAAKFDVLLHLFDTGREILGSLQYNADIFDASSMALMNGRFETLLRSIVERPDARLDELEFLTREERERREAEKARREQASIQRFKSIKSRTVGVPTDDVARTEQR